MRSEVREYLSRIGAKGGRKSRRSLSPAKARDMVRLREARRAYRDFHVECFWSFDPNFVIRIDDVSWVRDQLQKHGGRLAWERAARLCR